MGLNGRDFQKSAAAPYNYAQFAVDLPPTGATRWVPRRKAQVVAAVRAGGLSLADACDRYALTVEEFLSWQRAIDKHGLAGLRATHVQDDRTGR